LRKSPIRHHVRQHAREGKTIDQYTRGKGHLAQKRVLKTKAWPNNDKRAIYPSEFAKMGILKGHRTPIQQKEIMYYADWSIVDHVDKINAMGFETWASCSGTGKDHKEYGEGESDTYLTILLPESVASYETGSIKDYDYVDSLLEAGKRAGWKTRVFSSGVDISQAKYPTVTFYYGKKEASDKEKVKKWDDLVKALKNVRSITKIRPKR